MSIPRNDDSIEQSKKSRLVRASVWRFFKKNEKSALCIICNKEYKTSGNTSNLRDHLKRKHKDLDLVDLNEEGERSDVECQEKWENLRSVFACHFKPPPSGSGNKSKPYYLSEKCRMKFTPPYGRAIGKLECNLPKCEPPSTSVESLPKGVSQNGHLFDEENAPFNLTEVQPSHPPIPFDIQTTINKLDSHDMRPEHAIPESPVLKRKRKQDAYTDIDKAFKEYMDAKRRQIENCETEPSRKQKFLDSLLPEIEPLTEEQMRSFRRRVLQLIDEIRSHQHHYQLGLGVNSTNSPNFYSSASSSSTPTNAESREIHIATIKEEEQTNPAQYYPIAVCETVETD